MRGLKTFIALLHISLCVFCQANEEINPSQALILDAFFKALIHDSEVGYVLYGEKPICTNGISLCSCRSISHDGHKNSVVLYEGLKAWKDLAAHQSNFVIISKAKYDYPYHKIFHVDFINKSLVENAINKNICLFKDILGPIITKEKLIDDIIKKNDLDSVLRRNNVLKGILLGFGLKNSVLVSRMEAIEGAFTSAVEKIPFQRKQDFIPSLFQEHKESLIFYPKTDIEDKILQPSFGFNNIEEEYLALTLTTEGSSNKLMNESPIFCFGRCKEDLESKELIKRLEIQQDRIKKLLDSPAFLSDVLKLITGKEFKIYLNENKLLPIDEQSKSQIYTVLTQWIWNSIYEGDSSFFENFIRGIKTPMTPWKPLGKNLTIQNKSEILKIKKNLDRSNQFFTSLKEDKSFDSPVSGIFFTTLEEGKGRIYDEPFKVILKYEIFDPNHNLLSDSNKPALIDLKETIPGFAHGIKGMKIGEKRLIYIHPSMGYGIYTNLEKGIYLKAIVTLQDISSERTEFPKIELADMSYVQNPEFEKNLQDEFDQMAYCWGSRVGLHLSQSKEINIGTLINDLKRLKKINAKPRELTENEMDILNKIHWNIYFSN